MTKRKKNKQPKTIDRDIYIDIFAVFLIALTVIGYRQFGLVGVFLTDVIRFTFGDYSQIVYSLMLVSAVYLLFFRKKTAFHPQAFVSLTILYGTFLLWAAMPDDPNVTGFEVLKRYLAQSKEIFDRLQPARGGVVGAFFYSLTSVLVDRSGTIVVIAALIVLSLIILVDLDRIKAFFNKAANKLTEQTPPPVTVKNYYDEETEELPTKKKMVFIKADEPVQNLKGGDSAIKTTSAATVTASGNYQCPGFNLLENVTHKRSSTINAKTAEQKAHRLLEILSEFGINAELIGIAVGPAVSKIEIKPDSNVKISKIAAIQDNIKMELAAKSIRIEAPIPGRNAVGVEIPNVEMTPVRLYELITRISEDKQSKKLLFALGKDLMGNTVYCELDKMPHLLIAGATGSGKSVCVNGIITTILLRSTPDEVKLLLIDPKKVEFTPFHGIPHLIGPVISDSSEASRALKVIVDYMENRYEIFSHVGVRNITSYNEYILSHPEEKLALMPRIVVIIDELADLMATVGKDVEQSIQRITQLARAAGIHLIVATQRPSTDVITGVIKANIPSRIAFAVSSGTDSRVILDTVGAERLLGNGDMLYWPLGEPSSIRLQGVYVTDDEINRIAQFVSSQMKPKYDDAFVRLEEMDQGSDGYMSEKTKDPIYDEVLQYIIEVQRASTSLLQRKFGIGYNRAAKIIDMLEQQGMIGPAQGSKPREIYVTNEQE